MTKVNMMKYTSDKAMSNMTTKDKPPESEKTTSGMTKVNMMKCKSDKAANKMKSKIVGPMGVVPNMVQMEVGGMGGMGGRSLGGKGGMISPRTLPRSLVMRRRQRANTKSALSAGEGDLLQGESSASGVMKPSSKMGDSGAILASRSRGMSSGVQEVTASRVSHFGQGIRCNHRVRLLRRKE